MNAQQIGANTAPHKAAKRVDVVVVGAGFGGLYAVYKFREMGLKVQGFEAGAGVGGVWYWNRYPGARVDLPSIDYSYSFSPEVEQEWTWSEQYAAQPELLRYFNFVADRLDLRKHIQFNTRVKSAVWDEARALWLVETQQGERIEATYCVMATGPLSVPKDPEIEGINRFKGTIYRAARWPDHEVDFTGKRVGVIGTGSTGIQIVQEVGRKDCELFVFQRTPSFTMPMRNTRLSPEYVAEYKRNYAGIREAARNSHVGGVRPQSTRAFFSVTPEQRKQLLEDAWQMGGIHVLGTFCDLMTNEEANAEVADFLRSKIDVLVDDPVVAQKLKPQGYPVFARRACLDTGYYETYNRPNVHLQDCITDPIVEITDKGIRTEAGEVELDVLIFATGYDGLTGALLAFDVVGRNGLTVTEKWSEGARSSLSLMMAGFPNLFMTTGPNGPSALANVVRTSENDVDWIAAMITHMAKNGLRTVDAKPEAEEAWMEMIHSMAPRTLLSKAKTWYVGANVRGKAKGLTMFIGGFPKYREYCNNAIANGYADFAFEANTAPATQSAPAASLASTAD